MISTREVFTTGVVFDPFPSHEALPETIQKHKCEMCGQVNGLFGFFGQMNPLVFSEKVFLFPDGMSETLRTLIDPRVQYVLELGPVNLELFRSFSLGVGPIVGYSNKAPRHRIIVADKFDPDSAHIIQLETAG